MSEDIEQVKRAFTAYRVERELGVGGMATVYLARDEKHDRRVAIKILHPEIAAVLGVARFLQEIRVTANLQHPHILGLIDSGVLPESAQELQGRLYYVMPYVEGESLRQRLEKEHQLSVTDSVRIATEVAGALDYAHRHGIIHRDVKPENILLTDGSAIVADFGIALAVTLAAGGRMTQTGLSLGTPTYMSPEQAAGERAITACSDIYSLGAVTYEMLAGEPPFTGSTTRAVIARVMSEEPRSLTDQRRSVPSNVAAAVSRALEKIPADRFASAHEFAEALADNSFNARGALHKSTRSGEPKLRFLVPSAAAALFLVITLWGWRRGDRPRHALRYNLALDSAEALAPGGWWSGRLAISPDGSRLAYLGGLNGQVLIRRRDQLHAVIVPGSEKGGTPFFSPDGTRVGFVKDPTVEIVSVSGGRPAALTDSLIGSAGASWGKDGFIYADGSGDLPLVRIAARPNATARLFTSLDTAAGETDHTWPDVLPNGKGVIFTVTFRSKSSEKNRTHLAIAVADIKTGEHRVLLRDAVYARYAASGHLLYVTPNKTLMMIPFDQDAMRITGEPIAVADGVRLGSSGSADLAVSGVGTLIYVTSAAEGEDELTWVTRDGKTQLVDPNWQGAFWNPVLSPDGKRLAITVFGPEATVDIWTKELDHGPEARLTLEGSTNWYATWTPDGKSVTYNSNAGGSQALWSKRADGSAVATMQIREKRGAYEPVWSVDGKWLVFQTDEESPGSGDILGIRPGIDTAPLPLVATRFTEVSPALSSDGRWLAYSSDETGRFEIYVVPFPNTANGKWPVSAGGGTEPLWAHNRSELFYRDGSGNMVAAEVTTAPTFSVKHSTILFPATGFRAYSRGLEYAVSPDDRRFLMIRPVASAPDKLTVVENWFEELKEGKKATTR